MSLRCHSVSIACIVLFIFVFSSCFIHSYLKILTCWMGWNCKMRLHLESSTNPFWVAVIYQPSTTHRDRPERNRSNSKGTKRLFRLMRWKVWPNNLDSNWSWRRHNRTSRKPPSQAKFFPGFDELSTDSWQTQRCKNVWKKQGTVGRIEWFIYIYMEIWSNHQREVKTYCKDWTCWFFNELQDNKYEQFWSDGNCQLPLLKVVSLNCRLWVKKGPTPSPSEMFTLWSKYMRERRSPLKEAKQHLSKAPSICKTV